MKLTPEVVRHVAQLARLQLSSEEEAQAVEQLSAILEAVDTLREVDTEGVPPTSHAALLEGLLREDVVHESLSPERALSQAPARVDTSFVVPRVVE